MMSWKSSETSGSFCIANTTSSCGTRSDTRASRSLLEGSRW
jgi:hypothetical protein